MTVNEWRQYERFFLPEEFASPDDPASWEKMKPQFMDKLYKARLISQNKYQGLPFRIASGVRTVEHNDKVGGKPNSSHLNGWAADIKISNDRERYIMTVCLMEAGFNRFEIMDTWVHVDADPGKAPNIINLGK